MILLKVSIGIVGLATFFLIVLPQEFDLHFFHLLVERVDTVKYNKEYMRTSRMHTFKYNRTTVAMNGTLHFKIDVGYDLVVIVQTYKFSSNEYRLFPLRMGLRFCEIIKADFGGVSGISRCGNFTGCPLLKNRVYHTCNFVPNESKLPPYIPSGRYMLELQFMYQSIELFMVRYYVTVSRPEV